MNTVRDSASRSSSADRWPWVAAVLAILVLLTSFGVIYTAHSARELFRSLEQERRAENEIQIVWRQLQLERGTLAAHGRVEAIARESLHMAPVDGEFRVLVAE